MGSNYTAAQDLSNAEEEDYILKETFSYLLQFWFLSLLNGVLVNFEELLSFKWREFWNKRPKVAL